MRTFVIWQRFLLRLAMYIPFGRSAAATGISEAVSALNGLMTTYDASTGLWNHNEPSAAWWQSAIALQAVLDFMITTGNRDYIPVANYTINAQRASVAGWPQGGGDFRAASTDDTGWWALAVLSSKRFPASSLTCSLFREHPQFFVMFCDTDKDARKIYAEVTWLTRNVLVYSITGEKYLLDIAIADEAYMSQYWTSECDGGLIWQIRDLSYKAAISNELYIELTATLHNLIPGDEIYLGKSLLAWEWLKGSGMINDASLINDGLMSGPGDTCVNNNAPTWTYNQGVILGAMLQLYTATSDAEFINTARHIADAVLSSAQLVQQGVLTEPCADECTSADQHSFKGIFARYLAQLDVKLPDQHYGAFIASNAASMIAHDQVPSQNDLTKDFYGLNWQGPFDRISLGSQESAVMLLTAVLSVQM